MTRQRRLCESAFLMQFAGPSDEVHLPFVCIHCVLHLFLKWFVRTIYFSQRHLHFGCAMAFEEGDSKIWAKQIRIGIFVMGNGRIQPQNIHNSAFTRLRNVDEKADQNYASMMRKCLQSVASTRGNFSADTSELRTQIILDCARSDCFHSMQKIENTLSKCLIAVISFY